MSINHIWLFIAVGAFVSITGCNGEGGSSKNSSNQADGMIFPGNDISQHPPKSHQPSWGTSGPISKSCHSNDPRHVCLALKYVVYKDSANQEVASQEEALTNLQEINKIFSQCNIEFQIDEFVSADPDKFGLQFSPANNNELTGIRETFVDDSTLLLVTTGTWDRSGSLGNSGANAWTSMPGEPPYGCVFEKPVATFSQIYAHEIGHYLNLLHASDESNVMNPIIYGTSTNLDSEQCSIARNAVATYWQRMKR